MLRTVVLTLLFLGVIMVVVGFVKQNKECPKGAVEYRFVPRTFQEDQDYPSRPTDIFQAMFTEPSPWIRDISSTPRRSDLNRYFISQS